MKGISIMATQSVYPSRTFANNTTVSLVSEFDKKIRETLYANTYTNGMYSDQINFTGVKEVTVANVGTANLQTYDATKAIMNGAAAGTSTSRYGTVENLTNHLQTYTIEQDVSFTFEVDQAQNQDAINMFDCNRALQRTLREKVAPYLDLYRMGVWAKQAGLVYKLSADLTGDNIVSVLRHCKTLQTKNYINNNGVVLMRDSVYETFVDSNKFIYTESLAKEAISNYGITHIAGFDIKHAPDEIFPDGVLFFITQKEGLIAPQKLKEYRIHHCPPGLNGDLAEFRMRHDAFVLDIRADCCLVCIDKDTTIDTVTVTHAKGGNTASLAVANAGSNAVAWLTTDGTDPRVSPSRIEVSASSGTAAFSGLKSNMSSKLAKYVVYDPDANFMYIKGDFVF